MSGVTPRLYETVYIFQPTISDSDAESVHQKIDSVIKKFNGEVRVRDDWGTKDLAYEINDFKTGKYIVINYSGSPGVVMEIERHFKIFDQVMRYSTVLIDNDYQYQTSRKQIQTAEEDAKKAREARSRRYQ